MKTIKIKTYGFNENNTDEDIDLFFEWFDKINSDNQEERENANKILSKFEKVIEINEDEADRIDNAINEEIFTSDMSKEERKIKYYNLKENKND